MKIRLIIPECEEFKYGYYCKDSEKLDYRTDLLNEAIKNNDNIDLVVTSNNFFEFNYSSKPDAKKHIEKKLIPLLNKRIINKKPLVIGFDFIPKKRVKYKTNTKKQPGSINPYGGIDAVVCFLKVRGGSYIYGTHIWESWTGIDDCDENSFKKQNKQRVFRYKNKLIGLLSCGDIARYCHNKGELLPKVDIYLDLSHASLRGWTSQNRVPTPLINEWRKSKYVFVTQQVKNVSGYDNDGRYPFIFPQKTKYKVYNLKLNSKRIGVCIDINININ